MVAMRRRLWLVLGTIAVVCALGFSAVASAAGGGPVLVSPKKGAHVGPGGIRLIVRDTAVPSGFNVFVQISHQRKLNKFGDLAACNAVGHGCDFLALKHYRGHSGEWIYTSPSVGFPGFWATTPGRYYWQADHVNCFVTERDSCHVTSHIGSFVVP
jgi:hypothetical protein